MEKTRVVENQEKHLNLPIHKRWRKFSWIMAACLGCFILYFSFFPIPLFFLKPLILPHVPASYNLSLQNLSLVWHRWSHVPVIRIDHLVLTMRENNQEIQQISIPFIDLTPSWFKLLRGEFHVEKIFLSAPQWKNGDAETTSPTVSDIQRIARSVLDAPPADFLDKLPSALVLDNPFPTCWPSLACHLKRRANQLTLTMTGLHGFKTRATLTYHPSERLLALDADVNNLSLCDNTLSFSSLQDLWVKIPPISGTLKITLPLEEKNYTANFSLNGKNPSSRTNVFHTFSLAGTGNDKGITLTQGKIIQNKMTLILEGGLSLLASGMMDLNVRANSTPFPVQQLENLWPQTLGRSAREWILKNISSGNIEKTTTHFQATFDPSFTLLKDSLTGQILLQDLSINYLTGMPPIKGVCATSDFTDKGFDITLTKGCTHHQDLVRGKILIQNLDTDDETFSSNLVLKGTIPYLLEMLSFPPLEYTQEIDLPLKTLKGDVETTLSIDFPLTQNLSMKDVSLKTSGHLTRVFYDFQASPESPILHFSQGDLILNVTPQQLDLSGKALLEKETVTLSWKQNFSAPSSRQLVLKAMLNPFIMDYWGAPLADTIRGSFPLSIIYTPNDKVPLRFEADLTPASFYFAPLSWNKKSGERGRVSGHIHTPASPREGIKIQGLTLEGKNVHVKGEILLSPDNTLKTLTFSQIKTPQSHCNALITKDKDGLSITLRGKSADISGLLSGAQTPSLFPEKPFQHKLQANFKVDHLYAGGSQPFYQAEGTFTGIETEKGVDPIALGFQAFLSKYSASEKSSASSLLRIALTSPRPGIKRFSLFTPDAGILFKNLGWFSNLSKGKLRISVTQNASLKPFLGKITMEDFEVEKTPFLTHFFMTLASPTSFLNLFTGGQTRFNHFEAKINWHDGILRFRKARFENAQTGITCAGSINTKANTLQIKGNLIPTYILNRFINLLPGIRELLTGGEDDGIGATRFHVTGSLSSPQISVNPLHVLTPGIIKTLMSASEKNAEKEKELAQSPSPTVHPTQSKN